jgi:hypothetical protein
MVMKLASSCYKLVSKGDFGKNEESEEKFAEILSGTGSE